MGINRHPAGLGKQFDNADGPLLRGIARSSKRDYARALDDLSGAIAHHESVEGHIARAPRFRRRRTIPPRPKDYERATELAPKKVFDVAVQNQSKRKIKLLSKRLPCGGLTRTDAMRRAFET